LKFEDLNLIPEVKQGITDMGFDTPTKIQTEAIPIALEGHDILASSQTGSGKTAAFAIPILQKLTASKGVTGIRALILAPTRELAQQIDEHFFSLGYHTGLTSVTVYGGANWSEQEKALKKGVDIVVATPGRLLDMIKIISVDFSKLEILVLDEADRMLDMGFIPDVRNIVNRLPKKRQTLMFSATLTGKIESLAREMTVKPKSITIGVVKPAAKISQYYYEVPERLKVKMVLHLADELKWKSAVIFASTKRGVDQLYRALNEKGMAVTSIHGDRDQKEREAALYSFRTGKFSTIVATDVMARGIDVDNITHIINFDVPNDLDDYIHRIGRTARAEASGDAITFVSRRDKPQMDNFLRSLKSDITLLNIPDEIDSGGKPDEQRKSGRDDRRSGRSRSDRSRGRDPRQDDRRGRDAGEQSDQPENKMQADQDDSQRLEQKPERSSAPDRHTGNGDAGKRDDDHQVSRQGKGRGKGHSGRKPAEPKADRKSDTGQNGREKQKERTDTPANARNRDERTADDRNRNRSRNRGRDSNRGSNRNAGSKTSSNSKANTSPGAGTNTNRSRPKRDDKKLSADEKRIRDQQKLIERIQSPEIRGRNDKRSGETRQSEEKAGIWGKIKKIFGT
jgi:ATP-dependent RNA helicase RhlE